MLAIYHRARQLDHYYCDNFMFSGPSIAPNPIPCYLVESRPRRACQQRSRLEMLNIFFV